MSKEICVFGAGSIGCYVGGRLRAAGGSVSFIGRERLGRELREHGLHLTDYLGADMKVPAAGVRFDTDVSRPLQADLVLVTVKSSGTEDAARALDAALDKPTVIVSFQNGVGNADVLRRHLPSHTVLAGMVLFNTVNSGKGHFHQGSQGSLDVEKHAALAPFEGLFERAGLPLHQQAAMRSVQWAKLLLNLNNAINALSDLPLKEQLSQRAYRRCVALAQLEGLRVLRAAGIQPAQVTSLPPQWIPRVLRTPDWLFRRLAQKMIAIDPHARSSMWEDLNVGRATEVDWINGELVRLATSVGERAPVNERLTALVHEAENGNRRRWSGESLLAELAPTRS
ncbi:2-dehydropantoate 2-reductase [Pendulispora rubella]|uniref:2-dehydropantoate 2-reductase n=1 Tax=Pendulispora rubella TaxID=2741070 RepID=A0ABZ2KYG9_9BACT